MLAKTTMDDDTFRHAAELALAHAARIDARRIQPDQTPDRSWYIVRAVGKSDQQALDGLEFYQIESFYPQVTQMRKMQRRLMSAAQRRSGVEILKPQLGPLFPRYIFARFGMARAGWRDIFKNAGVGGMLCEGNLPVRVTDDLIERIKVRESGNGLTASDTLRVLFNVGDEVMITDGPFASFPGIVENCLDCAIDGLDPDTRIKVAVNLFGRATPVELESWQVAKR